MNMVKILAFVDYKNIFVSTKDLNLLFFTDLVFLFILFLNLVSHSVARKIRNLIHFSSNCFKEL